MKWHATRFRSPEPLIFVIVALICASVLVMYFQHRAVLDIERQRTVILQQIADQRVLSVAAEIRNTFDGPVRDVLLTANPPLLAAGRLDLIAKEYARGLEEYPQVERFFVWNEETETATPGEVLFYGGEKSRPRKPTVARGAMALFYADQPLGRQILDQARHHATSQRIYAAFPTLVNGIPYDIFVRLFYTDAARTNFFAVRGFAVNLQALRARVFPALYDRRLGALLNPEDDSPRFDLAVLDESGRQMFGSGSTANALSSESFMLQFYPVGDIESRMAASIPARPWSVVVSPLEGDTRTIASTWMQGYWFSGLSVVLMFVALAFAVQGRSRAAELTRMQADFVAQVSHQLKTPISLLSAVGETMELERVRSPEKLAQCVDIVRTESSRLTALIERVLEFSRLGDGARRYELEAVDLGTLVRETVDAFAGALASSGYQLHVNETGAAPIVAADPVALEQALINLLDNAIKYSGDSRLVTVTVGAAGGQAFIEVTDRGIGIPEEQRARIFERFYRGERGALHRQGFGLGLAITQELVKGQRGRIEVESTVGVGSTFRVRLPLQGAAERQPRSAVTPSKEPA